jgi:hypothetical protein
MKKTYRWLIILSNSVSEVNDMIVAHSADFIIGTGKYPLKDAGYVNCIQFGNSKKP